MTPEEQLIQRYFDAFNRHDIEGVMACFHDDPVIVDAEGRRLAGRLALRCFPTATVTCGHAPAMTAGAWRSRFSTAPVRERERS